MFDLNDTDHVRKAGEAAILRHTQLKAQETAYGEPCWTCRFYAKQSFSGECRHPFVARGYMNSTTGKTTWSYDNARSVRDKLCGEIGELHEPVNALIWWKRKLNIGWWMLFPLAIIIEILVIAGSR